jgi:folylpolyglutamate synthase/dihydropteroate synthase
LPKIAEEKAGIFKKDIPALTIQQDPDVERVLRTAAEKVGAPFDVAGKSIEFSYRFESSRMLGPHNRVCLTTANTKFEHLAVPLVGEHQAINCGLALSIIDKLKQRGFVINDMKAMDGLNKLVMPGRMEQGTGRNRPDAIQIHSARPWRDHDPDAVRHLPSSLQRSGRMFGIAPGRERMRSGLDNKCASSAERCFAEPQTGAQHDGLLCKGCLARPRRKECRVQNHIEF